MYGVDYIQIFTNIDSYNILQQAKCRYISSVHEVSRVINSYNAYVVVS